MSLLGGGAMTRPWRAARLRLAFVAVACVGCGDAEPPCVEAVRGETMLQPEWRYIPPGEFRVGTDEHDVFESPSVSVELTYGFWIQTSEVTNLELARVRDRFDREFPERRQSPNAVDKQVDSDEWDWHPHQIHLFFAMLYAYERSLLEGLEPCYDIDACEIRTSGVSNNELSILWAACARWLLSTSDQRCEGYRLPTLAEWERAAAPGTCTDGPCLERTEWSLESRGGGRRNAFAARAVGGRCANELGLYDMLSNSREFTSELYQYGSLFESYPGGQNPAFERAELSYNTTAYPFGSEPRCEGVEEPCGSVVLVKGEDGQASRSDLGHWNVVSTFGDRAVGYRLVRTGMGSAP